MAATKTPKTIAFLGATGGCGLSCLQHALTGGHTCLALARTPSKLSALLSASQTPVDNLTIVQGNAHEPADVAKVLAHPTDPTRLVDVVVFSIGGAFNFLRMTIDNPNVCERGIETLWDALALLRGGAADATTANETTASAVERQQQQPKRTGQPRIFIASTCGITSLHRDYPLATAPIYRYMLAVPHEDKRAMETSCVSGRGRAERWTLVRPSLLTDASSTEGMNDEQRAAELAKREARFAAIRVGKEDPIGARLLSSAVGYAITRQDVGRWLYERLILETDGGEEWTHMVASITH